MGQIGTVKKIAILVLILAVPGFLYYLLTAEGKNRYKPLPFFGPKQLAETYHTFHGEKIPDTIYHQVADFNLQDQDGKPVSFKTIGPQILIVNFFYTHCADVCDQVNSNVDSLVKYYGKNKLITFATITVDPERDNAAALKRYAAKFKSSSLKWLFLTGDTTTIYPLARNGFLVDALQSDQDNFIYSDKLILLDPKHRIRGYYSGTSVTDVNRLGDELKVQIAEELRKKDKPLY